MKLFPKFTRRALLLAAVASAHNVGTTTAIYCEDGKYWPGTSAWTAFNATEWQPDRDRPTSQALRVQRKRRHTPGRTDRAARASNRGTDSLWQEKVTNNEQSSDESNSTTSECDPVEDVINTPNRDAPPTREAGGPVKIVRFELKRLHERLKKLDFAVIDAAATSEKPPHLPWLLHMYDLRHGTSDLIGTGAFGEVYQAMWLRTPVVVKFMGYEADGGAYNRDLFFHELRVWFPLNHPHVVKLSGACHIGKRFFVCDYAGKETLVHLEVQYLHEQNILYNDLKCDNVLIGMDGTAKITDFGLNCILDSAEVQIDLKKQGVEQWKSLEYLRGDRPTLEPDAYSLGYASSKQ